MSDHQAINLRQKLSLFHEKYSPRIVAQLNDYHFKVAKLEGEFLWHSHPETDEAFLVIEGELTLEFRDGAVVLGPGELYVVPRGVEHKPVAEKECHLLLIEPAATVNTGDAGGERTVIPQWI
ncbi:MAG: cupin domain-containing protein [Thermoanaerobaculia bacterium]